MVPVYGKKIIKNIMFPQAHILARLHDTCDYIADAILLTIQF